MNHAEILDDYFHNGARKLHSVVDRILYKHKGVCQFLGICQKDEDDFYSIAGEVLYDILIRYDDTQNFDGFFYNSVENKIRSEFTKRNRIKRKSDKDAISIYTPINADGDYTIADVLVSDFNIIDEVDYEIGLSSDSKVDGFIQQLPKITQSVIRMKMENIPVGEIKERLKLNGGQYDRIMNAVRFHKDISIFSKNKHEESVEGKEMAKILTLDQAGNHKMEKYSMYSLLDAKREGEINCRYILQREPFQWRAEQINKYISSVLADEPIPEIVICEQLISGQKIKWLIDGLQRLSYAEAFKENRIPFKGKGAEFTVFSYKEFMIDENGEKIIDGYLMPRYEEKSFDAEGKYYRDMPEFLQRRFNNFNINVTTFFDCTDEDIAHHIRRYNNHESMSKSQDSITKVDAWCGKKLKDISQNHSFFKDNGKYTEANRKKGILERIVAESIMAINFMDDWKKELNDILYFIKENATDQEFKTLDDQLTRLNVVINNDTCDLFNSTNSMIWIAIFNKFTDFGLPDEKFQSFLTEFKNDLHSKKVNGKAYDDLDMRHTKDKKVIVEKLEHLDALMCEYLQEKHEEEIDTDEKILSFIKATTNVNVTVEDLKFYDSMLSDLTVNVNNNLRLLEQKNVPSLIAIVVLACEKDIDLDDWIIKFCNENDSYITNQKENYLYMKDDLSHYVAQVEQNGV